MRMRAYSPDTRTLCPSWRHSRNFCCSAGTVAAHKSRSLGSVVRSAVLDQEIPRACSEPRAVISHLVGKKLLQLSPHHSTVPLLHPLDHSLPFAAALQVYNSSTTAGLRPLTSAAPSSSGSDLVELHYVISGSGHFSNPALGIQQTLLPGDSVIALHGAASFAAGPLPDTQQDSTAHLQQQQQQDLSQQGSSTPAWSHLLGWLQQLHNKQQHNINNYGRTPQAQPVQVQQQQQQQRPLAFGDLATPSSIANASTAAATAAAVAGQSSNQLVTLQLLLPSELLTGQMLSHHAGHCQAVAQQLPWSAQPGQAAGVGPCELSATGSIHEQEVCGLLVDASLSSQHTAAQHQQQHQQPASNLHLEQPQHSVLVTIDQGSVHNSTSSSTVAATETSSKDSSSSFQSSPSHSPALSTLPTLSQHQIVKRALSEVGAFRLPQQTNRLALLFGPHSSPAVSLSFGVEVFEPGHVTPLHIHKQAHELFLVLGGKGQAVYHCSDSSSGSSSEQRVEVSPGDVAVFAPGVLHGIDNASSDQLYCLQMMLPNEAFVEWVQSGEAAGSLDVSALQRMAAAASCG